MHYFDYRNGILHAEDVALDTIARTVGTPFYCYSSATIERHYKVFAGAFAPCDTLVCYSIKANSNLSVIRTLAKLGSGADVVSEGEIHRALAAGIPPEKIVFSGVGKTRAEMAFALDAGIFGFNVESEAELRSLSEVAICARCRGADRLPHQPRCRREDARQDLHGQGRAQIRHKLAGGARALRTRAHSAGAFG